jgi:UDP-N-acetylglucosamine 1-carboxyvinyltransferase
MDTFVIDGGIPLKGDITVAGAKNVAVKALFASLLTDDPLTLSNVPHIRDVTMLIELLGQMGLRVTHEDHVVRVTDGGIRDTTVPLDLGARLRTSSMIIGPLLARYGHAKIPNPGGCRIGARPIDRHIEALKSMGAEISYKSDDGYFYATTSGLHGATVSFPKNTHTGTETVLLAAVLADGETVIQNAAQEVEVDNLILLLNNMGAKVKRTAPREITISGVKKLHGTDFRIMPDRNEEITFAIAAAMTNGTITVRESSRESIGAFLDVFRQVGGNVEPVSASVTRYSLGSPIKPADVVTTAHPGFMTDWQGPWAVMMTQAAGKSTIHETVFESRFSYVSELRKMGAKIEFFDPVVPDPEQFYNFNWQDRVADYHQAIAISGPTTLHNAVLEMNDLRAGATLVLAALTAKGKSFIHGVDQIDRGYERIEERLNALGARVSRISEDHE